MKRSFICSAIKLLSLCAACAFICLFLLGLKAKKMAEDVWKQLGLTQSDANININSSFAQGSFYYYGAKNAAKIAAGDRATVIRELAAHAKKYSNSDEFKKKYEEVRKYRTPEQPWIQHFSVDSFKEAERDRIQQAIKATEANANHANPKVRNAVPYRLESLRKELVALDDPNNRVIKQRVDYVNRSNEQAMKQYQDKLTKFNTNYPADPKQLIKLRLQQILDITADVDYSAELKESWGKKVFVNPVYEKKPPEWKLAYRTGKQATDVLRGIAQQWLAELK
jgi:hypothetical protein